LLPAAFVAVPKLPLPPLESQLLLPADGAEQIVNGTVPLTSHCSDANSQDAGSLQDCQQQTISSTSVLLQCSIREHIDQPMYVRHNA